MKISISLPDEDVEFVDAYASERGLASRSAVLHKAVRLLRSADLDAAYEDAFREWSQTDEAQIWEASVHDGLASDAPG